MARACATACASWSTSPTCFAFGRWSTRSMRSFGARGPIRRGPSSRSTASTRTTFSRWKGPSTRRLKSEPGPWDHRAATLHIGPRVAQRTGRGSTALGASGRPGLVPTLRRYERDSMAIEQFIDNEVKGNDVVLFMKGTPQFPMCGFSGQVVQILDHLGVSYKGLNVLESDDLRDGIKVYSNWPTVPQLYVKGEFVGGCDIVREMFQAGELQSLLKDKGVAVKEGASA